jgi:hypothetical protein
VVVVGYPSDLIKFQEPNELDPEHLQRVAELCETGVISAVLRKEQEVESEGVGVSSDAIIVPGIGLPPTRNPISQYAESLHYFLQTSEPIDINYYQDMETDSLPAQSRTTRASSDTVSTNTSNTMQLVDMNLNSECSLSSISAHDQAGTSVNQSAAQQQLKAAQQSTQQSPVRRSTRNLVSEIPPHLATGIAPSYHSCTI